MKAADEKRSKEQEKESFKVIWAYASSERVWFFFGIIFLLLGSVGDFVVPLYVGLVTTAISENNFEIVGQYCLQLFIIICVSTITISIGLRSLRRDACLHIQYNRRTHFTELET